jgi:hypothetical protein
MIVSLLCLLAGILTGLLLAAWGIVVVHCAQVALAPERAPEPVPFQRCYAADHYRRRRDVQRSAQWAEWAAWTGRAAA